MVGLKVKGGLGLIRGEYILLKNFSAPKVEINKLREISNISRMFAGHNGQELFDFGHYITPPVSYSGLKRQAVKLSFIVREYLAEKTERHFSEEKINARFFLFFRLF